MRTKDGLLGAGDGPLLWLDYADYAARLLADGDPPWLNTADCVAWLRKAQGLLRSDVVALPLQSVALAWVSTHGNLRQAMQARKKVEYPLKVLLGDKDLRAHLVELANGLRASFDGLTLALVAPTPGAWLELAYRDALAAEPPTDVDDDAVDAVAVYAADFLRAFGECGVDALLFDASAGAGVVTQGTLELFQPIFNVCGHYRWEAGLLAPHGFEGMAPTDMTFAVTKQPAGDVNHLELMPESFWRTDTGSQMPKGRHRLYARIPSDGSPEMVLQRLSTLR